MRPYPQDLEYYNWRYLVAYMSETYGVDKEKLKQAALRFSNSKNIEKGEFIFIDFEDIENADDPLYCFLREFGDETGGIYVYVW